MGNIYANIGIKNLEKFVCYLGACCGKIVTNKREVKCIYEIRNGKT